MSLKYRIPLMLSVVFILNILLLFLFLFFYTVPDLKEGIELFQGQTDNDLHTITENLEGKTYHDALVYLRAEMVKNSQLSFVLENTETKQRTTLSEERFGQLYFSASGSVDLAEGCYVLLLRSDINVYYSLDGTLLRLTIIEGFVLFVSFVIIACLMHSRYVKPLKRLTVSIGQFRKKDTTTPHSARSDEIGSLDRCFFELAGELRAEKENQSRIIASISHDIKTPLTSVMGFTERLLSKELDREKQTFYLNSIYKQSQNIEAVVNEFDDYLSFSNAESINKQMLSVSFIQELLQEEYTEICKNQNARLTFDNRCPPDTAVDIDGTKMRRVFVNLIGNAMKHNDTEGPEIRVSFEIIAEGLRITVADNGKGVHESELSHIFEPFYTSDKSRNMSGLGLSICAQIVKLHGGSIRAQNTAGGFAVQVLLPIE